MHFMGHSKLKIQKLTNLICVFCCRVWSQHRHHFSGWPPSHRELPHQAHAILNLAANSCHSEPQNLEPCQLRSWHNCKQYCQATLPLCIEWCWATERCRALSDVQLLNVAVLSYQMFVLSYRMLLCWATECFRAVPSQQQWLFLLDSACMWVGGWGVLWVDKVQCGWIRCSAGEWGGVWMAYI